MKSIILLIAFISIANSQVPPKPIPGWLHGTWQGTVGYEHDTTTCVVRIFVDSSKTQIRLISLSDGRLYRCSTDSVNEGFCRFKVKSVVGAKLTLFSNAVIDFMRMSGWPEDLIHIQLYPGNDQLWLGDLKKSK
jgi:hypothetical protein